MYTMLSYLRAHILLEFFWGALGASLALHIYIGTYIRTTRHSAITYT